ncbi:MAG: D-tyrosyl-tRNA(Tyr) deacylase [Lachnospiraceae bacterium]|nr:D-tyrosyl-tRNA(Tyr) deacylase [Lachnospiraceae bacterium]
MRAVIQRVLRSKVSVDGQVIGEIGKGYNVLLGVCNEDTREDADKLIRKLIGLRICEDENGKTNLSIQDTDGELLIISQFTLYADCRKGRRPSFTGAGSPEHAKALYEYVIGQCTPQVKKVAHGEFGAEMQVEIINDGPFTIVLDTADLA